MLRKWLCTTFNSFITLLFIGILMLTLTSRYSYPIPNTVSLEVTLSNSDSGLLEGSHELTIQLYDGDKNTMVWQQKNKSQRFRNGVTSITFGPFEENSLDLDDPKISIILGGDEVILPISSSFYAQHSSLADKAKQLFYEDALYILPTANTYYLGIGTKTPREKVEIKGNLRFTDPSTGIIFADGSSITSASDAAVRAEDLILPGPEKSVIIPDTSLGIGVNNPSETLHVSGNIRFQSLTETSSENRSIVMNDDGKLYTRLLPDTVFDGYENIALGVGIAPPDASLHVLGMGGDIFRALNATTGYGVYVNSLGRLGLGVAVPNAALHVQSPDNSTPIFKALSHSGKGLIIDESGKIGLGKIYGDLSAQFEIIDTSNTSIDLLRVIGSGGAGVKILASGEAIFEQSVTITNTANINALFLPTIASGNSEVALVIDSAGKVSKRHVSTRAWTGETTWIPVNNDIYYPGKVSIGTSNANSDSKLFVDGIIESSAGGFQFPDGTIQTSGLNITPEGYIGIGVASPLASMHVVATGNLDTVFRAEGQNQSGLTILSAGNLGIGLTSPTALLHLKGSNTSLGLFKVETPSEVAFEISATGTIGIGTSTQKALLNIESSSSSLPVLSALASNGKGLSIGVSGNIGIGTDSPEASLHVKNTDNNATVFMFTGKESNNFMMDSDGKVGIGTTEAPSAALDVRNPGDGANVGLIFLASGMTGEAIRIQTDGKIGIGTKTPSAVLSIEAVSETVFVAKAGSGGSKGGVTIDDSGDALFDNDLTVSGTLHAQTLSYTNLNAGSDATLLVLGSDNKVYKRATYPYAFSEEGNPWPTASNDIIYNVTDNVSIGTKNSYAKLTVLNENSNQVIFKAIGNAGKSLIVSTNADMHLDGDLSIDGIADISGTLNATTLNVTAFNITGNLTVSGLVSANSYINSDTGFYIDNSPVLVSTGNSLYLGTETSPALTTGEYNIFVGKESGKVLNTGKRNLFLGVSSGQSSKGANDNVFVGHQAGQSNVTGKENTYIGSSAGKSQTGKYNTFIGFDSGSASGSGDDNVMIGHSAGKKNTKSKNVFIGKSSGEDNSNGASNVFIGFEAGKSETGSNKLYIANADNSALIYGEFDNERVGINTSNATHTLTVDGSIKLLSSGKIIFPDNTEQSTKALIYFTKISGTDDVYYNAGSVAIGKTSVGSGIKLDVDGFVNATEYYLSSGGTSYPFIKNDGDTSNLYFGLDAGKNSTSSGKYNTILGTQSGYNLSGNKNTFVGYRSGHNNQDGHDNSFLGYQTGFETIGGNYNTFSGSQSGHENTSGSDNSYYGYQSGYGGSGSGAASYNSFYGAQSGFKNTGDNGTFIGAKAGYNNTANDNVFVGTESGFTNTSGSKNTFFGFQSGYKNLDGSQNSFFGYTAGYENTSGAENTFIGYESGHDNTTGSKNTYLGHKAGYANTGDGNVFIGYEAGKSETNASNKLIISNDSSSSPLIEGDFAAGSEIVQINAPLTAISYSDISDRRLKKNITPLDNTLEKLSQLTAVEYHFRQEEFPQYNFPKTKQIGLIAQELELIYPQLVSTNLHGHKAIHYGNFSAVLLSAIKEQDLIIQKMELETESLSKLLESLKLKMEAQDVSP